jgi:hypothetical protein
MSQQSQGLPIPLPELNGYRVDSTGQMWKVGNRKRGSNQAPSQTPVKMLTLEELSRDVGGNGVTRDKFPMQLLPGVWQLRFGTELRPPRFLVGVSVSECMRSCAFGPNRLHPDCWKPWNAETTAKANGIHGDRGDVWHLIGSTQPDLGRGYLETFAGCETDLPEHRPRSHFPYIVFGPLAYLESLQHWRRSRQVIR